MRKRMDNNSFNPYVFNGEVEKLVDHMVKTHYTDAYNKALEEKMFNTNPKQFKKIVENYFSITVDKSIK